MVSILHQFQSYLPRTSEGVVDSQIVAGDQLSIERDVNIISCVANGYTAEDRLEGMNLQIGEWHAICHHFEILMITTIIIIIHRQPNQFTCGLFLSI